MIKTIDEKYHLTERYRVHKYAKEMAEKYRNKWETKQKLGEVNGE